MKKVFLLTSIAIVLTACSSKPVKVANNDSVEYAVYAGTPLDYVEDCEPVYIPLSILGAYQPGDICLADSNGFLIEFPMRDAETGHPVVTSYHKVKITERLNYNKSFAK